ncbi:hypothetical protein D1AOALGA4SA_7121 [Olavius algarvensis Delta 1 endosymbiont]|nr:hypothetical protein D1AOALGA4SA_7121 [Olavius algarvensis Delta 1 endosymbiont]
MCFLRLFAALSTLEIENPISLPDRGSQMNKSFPVRKVGFDHWILGFEIYL